MNEYDKFRAEMLAAGKSEEEIERLWNTPADPLSDDYEGL